MKKILSLLALLVMTLTAFATDYTGHRTVIFGVNPPTESDDAVLTITDNGDNTFNVTFKDVINVDGSYTDNYGTYTFSNVAGTTENGVTTIDLSNLSVSVENCDFLYTEASDGSLFAKFNAEKAYARFSAAIGSIFRKSTISAEFGVDDFESTGGGEPGGEDKPAIVDIVEEGFKATGESWKKEGVAIDWDTQYIAAKLDLSTCKTSSGPENVLAVGTDITGWNDGPHYLFYYNKAAKVLQYNYLHSANKSYNRGFTNLSKAYIQLTDEVVTIEISKQGGLKINGESALVKYIDTASNPSNNSTESWTTEDLPTVFSGLWALNTIDFGGCQGNVMSNATYKYVKVAPLGWTEPTEPTEPEVTVTFEKQYADQLYSLADGTPSAMGDATVTLKEMSDNTISMSLAFIDMSVESTDLVKGTDEKDRITYTGTANFQGANYAVKALRYTKDEEEKLYMTLIPTDGRTLAFGTDPDYVAPEPPSIEGTVVEGSVDFAANGSKFEWSNIAIDWNKQKLVAVIDLSTCVGTNEDILSVGQNISAWQIGGW
ncbi:MAG: calycin-like domain-containing protein, partial [Prevotella sp.]|nr:calycin-like domain-containing protein [Prevotella sp.]